MVCGVTGLAIPLTHATTSTVPATPGGVTIVNIVGLMGVHVPVATMPPKVTGLGQMGTGGRVPVANPVPVTVTRVPPPIGPAKKVW